MRADLTAAAKKPSLAGLRDVSKDVSNDDLSVVEMAESKVETTAEEWVGSLVY